VGWSKTEEVWVTETSGPLAGVRVVELAGIGPGPFCGMLLADLGAEVIQVDRPGGSASPVPQRNDVTSRGKRRMVVDLKHPRGAEVVLRLAAASDALIEGYRPGVAERLGVGPADCLARNPALAYGRMTGWGQDGPLAASAGHDIGYIAVTGALHAIGRAGGPPQVPVNYLGDFGGGSMFLALGLVAGVLAARATGRGRVVDAAIVDGAAVLQAMTYGLLSDGRWTDERGANLLDTGAPFYDVYATADGRHMAVGALEPQFYAAFAGILFAPEGIPADLPAQHERSRWPELRARFAARFAQRSQEEWTTAFSGTDACVAPVRTMTEAPADPHLAARATYVTVDGVVQPAPAPRFGDGTPDAAIGALAPGRIAHAGAHTRDVLAALGFADTDELLASGAVWQA
jgi:alpha-methylacyl-CoA racemase